MTTVEYASYAASGVATVLAVVVWRARPSHRPVALLLVAGLAFDIAQRVARIAYVGAPRPFTGAHRVAFHVGQAAFVTYSFAVVSVCLVALAGRRAWPVGLAMAAYLVVLVTGYPVLRGEALHKVYAVVQAGLVAATVVETVVPFVRRVRAGHEVSPTEAVVLAAAAAEFTLPFGAMLLDPFHRWGYARASYGAFYAVAIFVQAKEIIRWMRERS